MASQVYFWRLPTSLILKTAKNDKIFERLHTARTAIPNHLPATTLPTNPTQTRIHPGPPRPPAGSPRALLFSCFFLCLCGFPRASGSGSGYLARRQITKKALCRGGSTAQGFFGLLCSFGSQRGSRRRSTSLSFWGSMRVGIYNFYYSYSTMLLYSFNIYSNFCYKH